MKLSFVFLCLSLATLSLASIPSAEEERSSLSRKSRKPSGKKVKKNDDASATTDQSSQATKKPVHKGKRVSKNRPKKDVGAAERLEKLSVGAGRKVKKGGRTPRRTSQSSRATKAKPVQVKKSLLEKLLGVDATEGLEKPSTGTDKISLATSGSDESSQEGSAAQGVFSKFALSLFPKELVELIGGYLEDPYSVVFTRNWSADDNLDKVAVDRERRYLITKQGVQASSHGDDEQVNLGSPNLSNYYNFCSSNDGRSLFFSGMSQEQAIRGSDGTNRWLVHDTSTKSLKSVTLEDGKISKVFSFLKLSTNGKTLLFTISNWNAWFTTVYQVKEHGKAGLTSKKTDINGYASAVSNDGNRILMEYREKEQLEVHDISRDKSHLVLEINHAGTALIGSCALNTDGSKAAFSADNGKLYIVDVDKEKEKDSTTVAQHTTIDIPDPVICHRLIYDAKDRLHIFGDGNLWLVEPSKRDFIHLVKAQVPPGYLISSSAISPNVDYVALLVQSKGKNENGKHQYHMTVTGDPKDVLMSLCGH